MTQPLSRICEEPPRIGDFEEDGIELVEGWHMEIYVIQNDQ